MTHDRKQAVLEGILRGIAAAARPGTSLQETFPGGPLAVAYSGGLDSRFLIHSALRAGLSVRALHVHGPHIPAGEHAYAVRWAERAGIPLTVVKMNPLCLPELRNNPEDRCYHCKKAIFTAIGEAIGNLPLCDGTNASDLGEYRPGLKALAELGIRSPLAEAGIGKGDIRAMGTASGLENPAQAAQPCLLTRFGYGQALSPERLAAVDVAEEAARRVFTAFGQPDRPFRLRYEDAATPALHLTGEALPPEMAESLAAALAGVGFPGTPVRATASLSGYFDRRK